MTGLEVPILGSECLEWWREPTPVPEAGNVSNPKIFAPKPTVAKVPFSTMALPYALPRGSVGGAGRA